MSLPLSVSVRQAYGPYVIEGLEAIACLMDQELIVSMSHSKVCHLMKNVPCLKCYVVCYIFCEVSDNRIPVCTSFGVIEGSRKASQL